MIKNICLENKISFIEVDNINSAKIIQMIRNLKPKILISVGATQRLSKNILQIVRYSINHHSSLLPKYAGISPYVWYLVNQEKYAGVTAHIMTDRIDGGDIISWKKFPIKQKSALGLLFEQVFQGSELMFEIVEKLKEDQKLELQPQDMSQYTYYGHPTKNDLMMLKRNGYSLWTWKELFIIIKLLKDFSKDV